MNQLRLWGVSAILLATACGGGGKKQADGAGGNAGTPSTGGTAGTGGGSAGMSAGGVAGQGGSAGASGGSAGMAGAGGRPVTPEVIVNGSIEGCIQDEGGQISFVTDAASVTGTAVSGATVTVEGTMVTTTTGADGCFTLDEVPAGLGTLTVDGSNDTAVTIIGEATINVGATTITRSAAVMAAETELANRGYPSTLGTWILATQQPVPAGVSVHDGILRLDPSDTSAGLTTTASPSWFVYVDPFPRSYFTHPTLFVLVDAETGAVSSFDTSSWPQLNRLLYYADPGVNTTSPDLITAPPSPRWFGANPPDLGPITTFQGGGTVVGLVIQGDRRADFETDANNFEMAISGAMGVSLTYIPPPMNIRGVIDGPRDIIGLVETLNVDMKPEDKFVVSVHTHGLPNGDLTLDQGFPRDGSQPNKARYRLDQIPWDTIKADNIVIMIDSCHAEAAAEPLKDVFKDPKFNGKKITIIAGTCANEEGGAGVPSAGDRPGGYVTNAVLDQLMGKFCPEDVVSNFNAIANQATQTSTAGEHIADFELVQSSGGTKGIGVHPKLITFNMPMDCSDQDQKVSSANTVGSNLEIAGFASGLMYGSPLFPTIGSSLIMGTSVPWGSSLTCGYGAFNPNFGPMITGPQFNNSTYPCGMGTEGLTLCENTAPVPDGDYIVVVNVLSEPVVLNDPTNFWTYGFVFDSDDNPANNFQPIPQFPNDFFQDTDRWYQAQYSPTGGWSLRVTDAAVDPSGSISSSARLIISGNALILVVPASEFGVARPPYRLTNFRHTGDFGQNPPFDWDGHVNPPVADGLTVW